MKKYTKGVITATLSVISLGSYSVLAKILLENMSPESLTGFAQLFSAITILIFFGFFPELKKIHRLPKKDIICLLFIAFLAAVLAPLLFFTGLSMTSATNSIILCRTEAVFIVIISFIWLKEHLSKSQILGIILMIIGVALIVTQNFAADLNANKGDLLILASSLIWAFDACIFKKYLHHIAPELVVLIRNTVGTIFLFLIIPFVFDIHYDINAILNKEILIPLTIFSLFVIVFGQLMWYKTLELIPASIASSISLLAPLIGIFLAVMVLQETLYVYHLTGGIIILTGLTLTIINHQKHPHHHKLQKAKHWLH